MSLINSMMEKFSIMNKEKTSDGEGGFVTQYFEGAEIDAVAVLDSTMQARIAEKQGVTSIYTITTNKAVILEYHDVLKRVSDGKIFRITSNGIDKKSPDVSSLNIRQVTAEAWELPTL